MASDPDGSLDGPGSLAQVGVGCVPQVCVAWAPSPTQTHLPLCPGCGPQEAGNSGRVWLHCSSPSCTRLAWARAAGSSHTGQPQSHRKLQWAWGKWCCCTPGPLLLGAVGLASCLSSAQSALHPWATAGARARPGAPTWPRAGPVLEEQVVQRDVGVLHASGHGLKQHLGRAGMGRVASPGLESPCQ